jgi:hypothetical protein
LQHGLPAGPCVLPSGALLILNRNPL